MIIIKKAHWYITKENNWCGEMTLPRELTLVNNHIYQSPVREIESYLTNKVTQDDITLQKDESIRNHHRT